MSLSPGPKTKNFNKESHGLFPSENLQHKDAFNFYHILSDNIFNSTKVEALADEKEPVARLFKEPEKVAFGK